MQIKIEINTLDEIIGVHFDTEEQSVRDNEYIYDLVDGVEPASLLGQIYTDGVISPKPLTTEDRYQELERIFNDKTSGLKKLAIDKPWMTDPEAINNQYRVYEEMYKNALADRYDAATNGAIITANETTKAALADLTLLLNSVRGVIEAAIVSDAQNVDELLTKADVISLTMADLTPAKMGEIKTVFGL